MIFDKDGQHDVKYPLDVQHPGWMRKEVEPLLEKAQQLGMTMTFCRTAQGDDESLWWTVREGFSHENAIRWMYTNDVYRKLYYWQKMCWHMMQEYKPYKPCEDQDTLYS